MSSAHLRHHHCPTKILRTWYEQGAPHTIYMQIKTTGGVLVEDVDASDITLVSDGINQIPRCMQKEIHKNAVKKMGKDDDRGKDGDASGTSFVSIQYLIECIRQWDSNLRPSDFQPLILRTSTQRVIRKSLESGIFPVFPESQQDDTGEANHSPVHMKHVDEGSKDMPSPVIRTPVQEGSKSAAVTGDVQSTEQTIEYEDDIIEPVSSPENMKCNIILNGDDDDIDEPQF
eukprot:GHVO01009517.1.p1 GENE.GHVO01009517.1~~GHVO01009517.1.p1  ORF type:complete len:230 (+),score=40.92 GHVO01009517.1:129-818(+)